MDQVAESSRGNADNELTRDYASEFTATQIFDTKEELLMWVKNVGMSNGITVVVLKSDSGNGKRKAGVTLGCEKSGKYDPRSIMSSKKGRRRLTGTKKCDCPFRLKGKKLAGGDGWQLKVVDGKHNHEAEDTSGKKQGHSFGGRLSPEEKSLVAVLHKTGKKPEEILRQLKAKNERNKSTVRTIYNEIQHLERDKWTEVKTSVLLESISYVQEEYNLIIKHRTSLEAMDGDLDWFITHPSCLDLLLAFPTALFINFGITGDWKTTLAIYGVTPTRTLFWVAWVFIYSEDRSRYEWALGSLQGAMDDRGIAIPDTVYVYIDQYSDIQEIAYVFSTSKVLVVSAAISFLIEEYFLEKSELEEFKNYGDLISKWDLLKGCPTEADFEKYLQQLETEFVMYPNVWNDLTCILLPYKEMFAAAWTDKIMHFGNEDINPNSSDTSYLDGVMILPESHPFLSSARLSRAGVKKLEDFFRRLHCEIECINATVKATLKASLENEYNDQSGFPELKELHGTISIHALELIRKQTILAREKNYAENCSCVIRTTHGLPCAHKIADYMKEGRPIPLECINSYWKKLDLEPAVRNTGEPNVERSKIKRPKINNDMDTEAHYVSPLHGLVESERSSPTTQDNMQQDVEEHNVQPMKQLRVEDICPPVLETYILEIIDVPRDGHCGFRVVASMLGITDHDGQPEWAKVRQDLQTELKFNSDYYTHLLGSKQEVDHLLNRLNCLQVTCPEKEHWMMMPEMGHLIASCYGVVLMYLSSVQSFTFFPLHTQPTPAVVTKEVVMGFCDEHFVEVLIREEHKNTHPMPFPAPLLTKRHLSDLDVHQQQRSGEWATRYGARIGQFDALITEYCFGILGHY